ncbi:GRASP55/65 PDZ-like domain-containing protein [Nemania sp. FL0031]|nr:GRASP55/65 PDZ-like domain-containing protein [Nemania sp. FL0031]
MFNALNRYLSRLDGNSQQQQKEGNGYGFQVLRNTNLELGVEPWFDFIVGINGRMIDNPDPRLFAQEVRNCAGSTVSLGIWSAKGQRIRTMHIPVPPSTGSLGLSLQWAPVSLASTVWHVLDVIANSPADAAGLLPYSDYILGTPDGILHGANGLAELVDDYIGRPLRLWVYNNEYDVTRELEVVPSREWGGEGALGCEFGFGALHRLPAPLNEPISAPGETMFDGGDGSSYGYGAGAGVGLGAGAGAGAGGEQFVTLAPPPGDASGFVSPSGNAFAPAPGDATAQAQGAGFLVPAQMATPPPPAGGTSAPPRGRKKDRHAHGRGQDRLMDDYLAEEEKKSRELDGNISASKTPPPPPPKAGGGPPRASGPPPPTAEEAPDAEGAD